MSSTRSGPTTPPDGLDPGSRAFLDALGFEGFRTVGQCHADQCREVPDARGVYAVLRESSAPPTFMKKSAAPAYRGVDPSRPIEELIARWVPNARLLFVGLARGPGVRSLLRQRVKRLLRFGHGRVVGHWSGRFVWQLEDRVALRVAWRATPDTDPAPLADGLLASFRERHGTLPFANEPHTGGAASDPDD